MKINNYISKDFLNRLVIGGITGGTLATIITSIIYGKAIDDSNKELELCNEELKKMAEYLEKYGNLVDEQNKIIKKQNKTQKEANNKIKELTDELNNYIAKEAVESQKKKEAEIKKAIKRKDWNTVYNKTERWYNKYPVDMSRQEVFRNLEKDGYITDENYNEAKLYFKDLWNYVGD